MDGMKLKIDQLLSADGYMLESKTLTNVVWRD